jgi:hypothetical membrane protein
VYILLVIPIIFILITSVLGIITPNYDWRKNYISELSLGKYGWIQKLNFIICGTSIMWLCIFLAGKTDNSIVKIAWYMGSIMGIPIALAGIWDTDFKRVKTLAGRLHNQVYNIGMIGTGLTYFLMGLGYRNKPIILIFSWVIAVFDYLWWKYSEKLGVKPGIGQRIIIFSSIMWVEILAAWTLI